MLSISNIKSSAAAVHYYEHDDYYAKETNEHKELSEWYGKGAERLRLEGKVEKEDFKQVLEGELPNGVELGRVEDGKRIHAPGMDLTFSAPKSVSILAEVYGDKRINEAHDKAVKSVLTYIEENLAYVRKTENGKTYYEKADNILASLFQHNTSRNLDPQLHTHCILANAIRREDGEWRSAYYGEVFENKKFLGMMYRSELAHSLTELGYTIERTHEDGRFEVKEVPQEIIQAFSSRREEIKLALEGYEHVNAKTAANATLVTRQAKTELPKEVLINKWQETLKSFNFNLAEQKEKIINEREQLKASLNKKGIGETVVDTLSSWLKEIKQKFEFNAYAPISHINNPIEEKKEEYTDKSIAERAIEYGVKHLSERASVWEEKELIKVASTYALGRTSATKILEQIAIYKREGTLLESKLRTSQEIPVKTLTTKEALAQELESIKIMQGGKGQVEPICNVREINEHIKSTSLKKGQVEAVKVILTTKDRVVGVQGYAGAGKTYMMKQAKELAGRNGYQLIGMAPSASAAKTLEADTGIKSQTVSRFLTDYERLATGKEAKLNTVKMKQEMRGKVLIIDESSLASTIQFNTLLKVTRDLDVRLVAIGDTKQLGAVEAGKPFYQLQRAGMETAKMTEIVRQKEILLRGAVYDSINARIKQAMFKIDKNITEVRNKELGKTAAEQWLSLSTERREETLVIVPSKKLREETNKLIREGLKLEGKVKGEEHGFIVLDNKDMTHAQMSNAKDYSKGDIVIFNRDYKSLKIERHDMLRVREIKDFNVLVLERSNGKKVMWQPHRIAGNRKGGIEVYEERKLKLQEGDKIRWTRNSMEHPDIINSMTSKVLSIGSKSITVELESGKKKTIASNDKVLRHMDYAYTSTVHASQGKTYAYAISVIEGAHKYLTHQQVFYVSLSRAEYEVSLITDDKKELITTLKRQTGERVAATEHQAIKYTEPGMQQRQNTPNLEVKLSNIDYNRQAGIQDNQVNSKSLSALRSIEADQSKPLAGNSIEQAIKEQNVETKAEIKETTKPEVVKATVSSKYIDNVLKETTTKEQATVQKVEVKEVKTEIKEITKPEAVKATVSTKDIDNALKEAAIKEQAIIQKAEVKEVKTEQGKSKTAKINKFKEFKNDSYTTRDIYSHLYARLPSLLPEFGFRYKGGHYVSTTNQKIDGSAGHSKGKVYVYANNPGVLIDYTRKNISIWDYVKDNHMSSADKSEVMNYLLEQAGLRSKSDKGVIIQIPKSVPILEEKKNIADTKLLGDIHKFAVNKLFNKDNKVSEYLKQDRGYDEATIKKMELGYIKNKKELGLHLKAQGWSNEKVKEAYSVLGCIGNSHNLIIPYKDAKGEVIGLVGRNIHYQSSSEIGKYMYTKGLAKSHTLLNIHNTKAGKETVIVEGMLDCLHANAKGIDNVVALGGTSFNATQLKQLQDIGINKINLCLDNDKAGNEAAKNIKELISTAKYNVELKQTTLPQNIKDPDQMIKEKGIDAFKETLTNAKSLDIKTTEHKLNELNINNSASNIGANYGNIINKGKEIDFEL